MAIDIGSGAIDRNTHWPSQYTVIDRANPANAAGTLLSVQIWAETNMSGVRVGTFYGSGEDYTCRDYAVIGDVVAGRRRTFTGLSIDVQEGDLLGIYTGPSGHLEANQTGGSGVLYLVYDQTESGEQTYSYSGYTTFAISIYATDIAVPVPSGGGWGSGRWGQGRWGTGTGTQELEKELSALLSFAATARRRASR
jgi:hypothetical protein